MPTIKQNITTVNRWVGGNSKQWIVIHNVGTKPTYAGAAYNNTAYFKSTYRGASAHYFIDDGDVIWQCVNDNDRAWSVGDSYSRNGCNNYNSINIEVCGNSKFTANEIENLKWLVQRLMAKYNIPASRVCRHHDVTTKNCPAYYVNDSNWVELKAYIIGSSVSAPSGGAVSGSGSSGSGASLGAVNVRYALRTLNGQWLSEVTNFNNSNSNGYAGIPNGKHDLLYIKVDKGSVKYRVHTVGGKWLPWVTKGDKNDTVNGCAGLPGKAIDGVQIYYTTPSGYTYQQAWYRSQTTKRAGWLDVCCDDGNSVSGYDGWAGMLGEPLDRLQVKIGSANPF